MSDITFKFLFDNSSDGVIVCDMLGRITEINDTALKLLGFAREEVLGKSFRTIVSPKYQKTAEDNLLKIKELGEFTNEAELFAKTGSAILVELKSRLIRPDSHDAILTVARNISERKALEQRLFETILKTEEKERKRFAADLHDGLSPILSTIKLYADLLKNGDLKPEKHHKLLTDIDNLADLAISTAKDIAVNITPSILNDFGLPAAVSEFCKYVKRTQKIDIEFSSENYTETEHSLTETVLYQAIKELINNALKHSEAKIITMELKSTSAQILLYYKDDGVGFDVEQKTSAGAGLGLKNIINKIKTVHGTCDFYSQQGNGTRLLINIKK